MTAVSSSLPEILVVDDDAGTRSAVADALDARGYRVAEARDGEEALRCVAQSVPQLILLDIWMPTLDGWGFARTLRERYGRRIPLVVMTAGESSQLRADEIGANTDLGKPLQLDRLYDVVADLIGAP